MRRSVSHWIWYRVGSRNEVQGKTGISHWVEHMQFKGTEKYPVNVLDAEISKVGGNLECNDVPGSWTTITRRCR